MTSAPIPRPSYGLGYLLTQLQAALHWHDKEAAAALREGLPPKDQMPLAHVRKDNRVPKAVSIWFGAHDGSDMSVPIDPVRRWFALPFEEALKVIRTEDLQDKKRGWTPLFRDEKGRDIYIREGYSRNPLVYLDEADNEAEKAPLPTLFEWIWERLDAYGWKPKGSSHKKSWEGPIGELLEELDALIARDPKTRTFRPGASPEAIAAAAKAVGLPELPPDIAIWFMWHDGQEGPVNENIARIHPVYNFEALTLSKALDIRKELLETDTPLPDCPFLPLFLFEKEGWRTVISADLSRPAELPMFDVESDDEIAARDSFRIFLNSALEVRRRRADTRITEVPDGYSISVAQQWVLAVRGILDVRNRSCHQMLGGHRPFYKPLTDANGLKHWWGIYEADGVHEQIASMLEPHEATLASNPALTGVDKAEIAWDMGRIGGIADGAYHTRLVDAQTAWDYMVRAAVTVQRSFSSWAEFGQGYAQKFNGWNTAMDEEDTDRYSDDAVSMAVAQLLAPDGLWSTLPWEVDLTDVPLPPDINGREFRVSAEPAPERMLLHEALQEARDGDRLILDPGTYTQALLITRSIEIIGAAPGVTIAAEGGEWACIHIYLGAGVLLKNLTVVARGGIEGCSDAAVQLDQGHLTIDSCTITGEEGVCMMELDAVAIIRNSTVHATGSGAVWCSEDQTLLLYDCTLSGGKNSTLTFKTGGYGAVRNCTIRDAEVHAIMTGGTVHLENNVFKQTGGAAVAISSESNVVLRECQIMDSAAGGVMAKGKDVRFEMYDCSVTRTEGTALEVTGETTQGYVENCTFHDTVFGVLATDGGALRMAGGKIENTRYGSVQINPDSIVSFNDCTIGTSREAGVISVTRGELQLQNCRVAPGQNTSIVVEGGTVYAENTTVDDAKNLGIFCNAASTLTLVGCRILNPETKGVWVREESKAALVDTLIESPQVGAAVENATCHLQNCTINNFKQFGVLSLHSSVTCDGTTFETNTADAGGIQAHTESRLICNDCRFRCSDDINIHVHNSRTLMTKCKTEGGVTGVTASEGAHAQIFDLHARGYAYQGVELGGGSNGTVRESILDGSDGEQAVYAYEKSTAVVEQCRLVGGTDGVATSKAGAITLVSCDMVPGKKQNFDISEGGTIEETEISPDASTKPGLQINPHASGGFCLVSTDAAIDDAQLYARIQSLVHLHGETLGKCLILLNATLHPDDTYGESPDTPPFVCYADCKEDLEALIGRYRDLGEYGDAWLDQLAEAPPAIRRPIDILQLLARNPMFNEALQYSDVIIDGWRIQLKKHGAVCVLEADYDYLDEQDTQERAADPLTQKFHALHSTMCSVLADPLDADSPKIQQLRSALAGESDSPFAFIETAVWETETGDFYLIMRSMDDDELILIEAGVRYKP